MFGNPGCGIRSASNLSASENQPIQGYFRISGDKFRQCIFGYTCFALERASGYSCFTIKIPFAN